MTGLFVFLGCVFMVYGFVRFGIYAVRVEREDAYEPETIPEGEASVYRLGIMLGVSSTGGSIAS